MMKKRFLPILTALLLLSGCGPKDPGQQPETDPSPTQAAATPTEAPAEATPTESAEPTEAVYESIFAGKFTEGITIPELNLQQYMVPENEGTTFTKKLGIGFNLGNTFDAYDDDGYAENELAIEEYWQGVHTTEQLIKDIHAFGFDSIRIPVSWHNHVSDDFTISEAWLDRVNEVVDYAINDGMYVIINIHHDNDAGDKGFYPDQAHAAQSDRYVSRIWSQLAEHFKDYDEHLVFEALNEPRLVGNEDEWWFNAQNPDCVESMKRINELNQLFVDTVRASGGNNASRFLMCPGYCACLDGCTNAWFKLPTDNGGFENRIILEVHGYTPYSFALEYPGTDKFNMKSSGDTSDISYLVTQLYQKFICSGIPVVIDEFGARDKGGNLQARVDYAAYYSAYAASRGIPVFWWDNGAFSGDGELFGIVDRRNTDNSVFDIIAALTKK